MSFIRHIFHHVFFLDLIIQDDGNTTISVTVFGNIQKQISLRRSHASKINIFLSSISVFNIGLLFKGKWR